MAHPAIRAELIHRRKDGRALSEEPEVSTRGGFFIVSKTLWAKACDLGLNESVAYLGISCGSGADNRTSSWSLKSLRKYTGISWDRGKLAIENLINSSLISYGEKHSNDKPKYRIASTSDLSSKIRDAILLTLNSKEASILEKLKSSTDGKLSYTDSKWADSLCKKKLARRLDNEKYEFIAPDADDSDSIWLPNTLVTGTKEGEDSPVWRLRANRDGWALRLLVDLYYSQNLRDDGGIGPWVMRDRYDRLEVGKFGAYTIWAFKRNTSIIFLKAMPLSQTGRPSNADAGQHPVWDSFQALQSLGLVGFVPHIWDGEPGEGSMGQAEILHPYGIAGSGEDIEVEIASAAQSAAERVCHASRIERAENDGFVYLCPVRATIPQVQMIGVARLSYRPKTKRTGAWFGNLQSEGRRFVNGFDLISPDASKQHKAC